MGQSGILDVENNVHLFTLHHVFLRRINRPLDEYKGITTTGPHVNNVVVTPVNFTGIEDIRTSVEVHTQNLDFDPSNLGIDEYESVLNFIYTILDT